MICRSDCLEIYNILLKIQIQRLDISGDVYPDIFPRVIFKVSEYVLICRSDCLEDHNIILKIQIVRLYISGDVYPANLPRVFFQVSEYV